MHTLKRYWGNMLARLFQPAGPELGHAPAAEALEREISAISGENRALADAVQRARMDFERARDEESRKIVDLERVRQTLAQARDEDQRQLSELQSLTSRFEAARKADGSRILDLETRLAVLEAGRNQARDQVKALENSLTETTSRLERTDGQLRELQAGAEEQARQFQTALASAGNRLESTENALRGLETRLEHERRQAQKTFDSLQERFRQQDRRLKWSMVAAGFAVLLGLVAGSVLIRGVQKNATLLSGMGSDIKEMMTTVNESLGMPQRSPDEGRPLTLPTALPDSRTADPPQPAPPAGISAGDPEPNLPGSVLEDARNASRLGKRQSTRADAQRFFEENAAVDGMISLPSGVQYRVVKPGSGQSPSLSDQVVVSYVAIKRDGTVFGESYSTGAPRTLRMDEVIPGWQEVLLKMQEGAEFELYVPPNLATKGGTRKRSVLGFEPSIYLIELLQVVKYGATDPAPPAQ